MIFWKRWIGDYQRDTAQLTLAEHGAYGLLLDDYYSRGEPLAADRAALYRLCRATSGAERRAVDTVIRRYFPISADDGLRHNARADIEIVRARTFSESQAAKGRKGGRPPKPGGKPGLSPGLENESRNKASEKASHSHSQSLVVKDAVDPVGSTDTRPKVTSSQATISVGASAGQRARSAPSAAGPIPIRDIVADVVEDLEARRA